jgi:hypothetical protein
MEAVPRGIAPAARVDVAALLSIESRKMLTRKKKVIIEYYLYKKMQQKEKRKKKMWVHSILSERKTYGVFYTLFEDLKKDEMKFFNFFRMSQVTFQKLLTLVQNKLRHVDTDMR